MAPDEPADLDLGAPGALDDPYARLAALRAEHPVRRIAGGFWAVTGHGAALEVMRHPACASSPIALRYLEGLPDGAARDEMVHRINFLDPPDHPRVRSLVSKAFTPRRIAELRPWIDAAARSLLDGLERSEPIDLIAEFTHRLPSLVISELLGVPSADRDRLTAWSDEVAPLLSVSVTPAERDRAVVAATAFHAYLDGLLDERRLGGGDDLLSALLEAEEAGERLSRAELLSLAATLYSAGHRTTRDLVSNGLSVLLGEPRSYELLVDGTWSPVDVTTEALRYETPTLYVARVPLAPIEVAGVSIGPWEPVLVFLGAANRDPAAYDEPDVFAPGRVGPPSLSFAFGAHYCLGASLARSEAESMLDAVRTSAPDMRLADGVELTWHQRGPFRGLDRLPVVLGRPA